MTMREEIRAALVGGPATVDELLPQVPANAGDRPRLASNIAVLCTEKRLRRAGLSDDGKPLYQINVWPVREAAINGDAASAAPPRASAKPGKPGPKPGAARVGKTPRQAKIRKTGSPSAAQTAAPPKSQRPATKTARKAGKQTPAKTRARSPGAAIVAFENGQLVTAAVPRPLLATLWHSDTGTPDPTIVSRTRAGDIVLTRASDGAYSVVPAVVAREIAALVAPLERAT